MFLLLSKCFLFFKNSTCFIRFKCHFFRSSIFKQDIDDIFLKKYDLSNVLDNDFDAILSRIYFVFNREPSSMYVPFYFWMNIIVNISLIAMSLDEIKFIIIIIYPPRRWVACPPSPTCTWTRPFWTPVASSPKWRPSSLPFTNTLTPSSTSSTPPSWWGGLPRGGGLGHY